MLKQKTVYFREEDLPLWEAVENKAEWLHKRLTFTGSKANLIEVDAANVKAQVIKTKEDAVKAVERAECDGKHYMFRVNCGRRGCPW